MSEPSATAAAMPAVVPDVSDLRAEFAAARASPLLVESARRKTLAVHEGLEVLAANSAAALLQLELNRDNALAALETGAVVGIEPAAVLAGFATGVDAVHASTSAKRTGLETELVTADAALSEAIDVVAALENVSCARRGDPGAVCRTAPLRFQAAADLHDDALARIAPVLSARLAAAQAAVAAS